jgi:membrane dipeptidase
VAGQTLGAMPPRLAGDGLLRLAAQVGRVPSMRVPLDAEQEARFNALMSSDFHLVDMHQHTMVMPEVVDDFVAYADKHDYTWGWDAARAGRWSLVGVTCNMVGVAHVEEGSYLAFSDLVDEIGLLHTEIERCPDVYLALCTADATHARAAGKLGVLVVAEHLALGDQPYRVNVLYGLGVRMAGLTYTRKSPLGSGQNEDVDEGLTPLGGEVVRRMNDLGMLIDLSHAGQRTALDAIEASADPVVFSHNAAYRLRATRRTRKDEELLACAAKGGLICVTAVPNSLSDDPHQDISCVLDHYDYLLQLVGEDHVGIGTDTVVGDHVGFTRALFLPPDAPPPPAPYLDGLESPADGYNIVRGLIARGHSDTTIRKIAGVNALNLLRRVVG